MRAGTRIRQIERRRVKPSIVIGFQHTDGQLYTESEWSGTPGQRVDVASLPKGTSVIRIVYVDGWGER